MILPLRYKFGGFVVVLVVSLATHLINYHKPAELFWDENFHIASAQRYLNGVFFLEPHPPLGKFLIAAGEWLLDANETDDQFVSIEKAEALPRNFSFFGYRFFPAFFGALIAPAMFLLIFALTKRVGVSVFIGLLPALDNALIVHNRGAMLDAPLILFVILGVWFYFRASEDTKPRKLWYLLLGISAAMALSIKINGAVLCIFAAILLAKHRSVMKWLVWCVTPAILVYLSVWFLHFFIAHRIDPKLQQNGLFNVSPQYAVAIEAGESRQPSVLLWGIKEAFAFSSRYQEGVPRLDYCKEDETGSEPIFWPLGGRAINYRWERVGSGTQFLYLVPNLLGWLFGIIGVVGGIWLLCTNKGGEKYTLARKEIAILLFVYLTTWLTPYLMPRVFYLYHYFIALMFSWILFAAFVCSIRWLQCRNTFILGFLGIGGVYAWLSPLTYYGVLSDDGLRARNVLKVWDLKCPSCPSYYQKFCSENLQERRRTNPKWNIFIGPLRANHIEQGIGDPMQEATGFVVTTRSKLQFPINKVYVDLKGSIELLGDLKSREVEVQILADGETVFKSKMTEGSSQSEFGVSLIDRSVLIITTRAIDGSFSPVQVRWRNLIAQPR